MAFIGTPLDTRNTFQSLQGKRFNGDGSETDFTLDVAPSSVLDIEVFVGNVRQDPNSAYTLSGTTLTFTGAPPSGTNNIYVVHQAKSVGTIDPPATETVAKTFSGATTISGALVASSTAQFDTIGVGAAKDLGTGLHIKTSDSGASANSLADELVVESSGTDVGASFLCATNGATRINFADSGDNDVGQIKYGHDTDSLFIKTAGVNHLVIDGNGHVTKPKSTAFLVRVTNDSTHQNIGTGVTDLNMSTEIFDVNADYATSTFTAPVTGTYFFQLQVCLGDLKGDIRLIELSINCSNRNMRGNLINPDRDYSNNAQDYVTYNFSCLTDMDASDTATPRISRTSGTSGMDIIAGSNADVITYFSGHIVG